MLVLTRKKNEALVIHPAPNLDPSMTVAELFRDGPIKIKVYKQVKIGIEAPQGLTVLRDELQHPHLPADLSSSGGV